MIPTFPKLSVLMSIYNEPLSYIRESIDSVLRQTYSDFEFIIVIDNPNREDILDLTEEYLRIDERLSFLWNDDNIGLALSMNKAAMFSSNPVLVRMDADDVAVFSRFEAEVKVMTECGADVVFSNYASFYSSAPDFNSEYPVAIHRHFGSHEIPRKMLRSGIIHHPTVMMTRDLFFKVGMYRNFPCAQDKDLWLRMLYAGGKFCMVDECLLYYRRHSESISQRMEYKQHITIDYIKLLFIERLLRGEDSFNSESYCAYIAKRGVEKASMQEELSSARVILRKKKNRVPLGFLYRFYLNTFAFMRSRVLRHSFFIDARLRFFFWKKMTNI